MHIHRAAHIHGPQSIGPPHTSRVTRPISPSQSAPIADELQISDAARLVEQVNRVPDIRQGRVESVRSQIAAGVYETDEKLQIALSRLLDEIG